MKATHHIKIGATAALCCLSLTAFGQAGRLYLTEFNSANTYIVQGGAVVGTFSRFSATDGPALAITTEIRAFGRADGQTGSRYDLAGNLLQASIYSNPSFTDCYDGATSGTQNWSIAHNDFDTNFAVIAASGTWAAPGVSFVPANRSSGITYDATDNTLWITNNSGGASAVQHYTVAGSLINTFSVDSALANGGGYGLALDSSDNTLWIPGGFGSSGRLWQYSKAGTLMNIVSVGALNGINVMGAEFAAGVPEPSSMLLIGAGLALLARRRRK